MRGSVALLVAVRYFQTRRRDTGNASSFLSVLGIAVGVMTLTVVLAIMNGFQLGFIESIVEISSYHLQVREPLQDAGAPEAPGGTGTLPLEARLRALPGITAAVPFAEVQALAEGVFQRSRPCVVRAVPPDLFSLDPVQALMLAPREGAFSLAAPGSIVIGSELAAASGARVGDLLLLTALAAGGEGMPKPRRDAFRVTGIFHSGYLDFDAGLVFIPLATADELYGARGRLPRMYGLKIADRFRDSRALAEVSSILSGSGYTVESWRRYNKSFFDALFMEKLMMMVLVGLIFVVVGFNVYHSLRRSVFERMEEIAVLKAVGIPPRMIQSIFVLEGLLIGLVGAVSGLIAGLAVSVNVNGVFGLIERAINGLGRAIRLLASPFAPTGGTGGFAIFSPTYFYLSEVPSRVFFREAFLVAFFALIACAGAAWAASRAVSRFRPAEVLRYE